MQNAKPAEKGKTVELAGQKAKDLRKPVYFYLWRAGNKLLLLIDDGVAQPQPGAHTHARDS